MSERLDAATLRAVRVGFVMGDSGFAAVLYRGALESAFRRTPWFPDVLEAMRVGQQWGERIGIPVDIVQVDERWLHSR